MPLIQLLILSNAATYEIKNIKFNIIDLDQSKFSRDLTAKFVNNGYFVLTDYGFSEINAEENFKKNTSRMILQIPHNFERDFRETGKSEVQIIINAEDGSAAGLIYNYASGIVMDFSGNIRTEYVPVGSGNKMPAMINILFSDWFNPDLNYKTFMVPGILVVLVSMIGMFLAGMNIAREKEIGTIEQLNVTPIKKYQFIIGKLFPFWIIGLFELTFGTITGIIIFNVPFLGSPMTIFVLAGIYLIAILGLGLFVSTITDTQQQAMFISWFIMVIFMLMGGIFTPIESMPDWAQKVTLFNPLSHFTKAMRMIMLKGSGLSDVLPQIKILSVYSLAIITLAVWRYKKVS